MQNSLSTNLLKIEAELFVWIVSGVDKHPRDLKMSQFHGNHERRFGQQIAERIRRILLSENNEILMKIPSKHMKGKKLAKEITADEIT